MVEFKGLRQVAQRVEDLDRAVSFYRDMLELPFIARFDPPGLAFFDLGGTRLLLEHGPGTAVIYLEVDDVRDALDALRARGIAVHTEAHVVHRDDAGTFGPPGEDEWLGFVGDTEGNVVGLMSRG
jgi:methylmalonyl-CoA/ethylmalonyl-CoA epimerase